MASKVWDHYKKKTNDPSAAICQICEAVLSCKDGTTSSLMRHLERKHSIALPVKRKRHQDDAQSQSKVMQPTYKEYIESKTKLSSERKEKITYSLAKMIFLDLQPLSVIEDVGLRQLLNQIDGKYIPPSRKIFRQLILPTIYNKTALKVKTLIAEYKQTYGTNALFSITTDCWTSVTNASYVTYTLHIVKDYAIVSVVLATTELKQQHSAENLRNHIFKTLHKWQIDSYCTPDGSLDERAPISAEGCPVMPVVGNRELEDDDDSDDEASDITEIDTGSSMADAVSRPIDDTGTSISSVSHMLSELPSVHYEIEHQKRIVLTTDNASNITKAVAESSMTHIRCFAHTINLAVQKFVRVIDDQLAWMRVIIRYFNKSPRALSLLKVREISERLKCMISISS